MNKTAITCLALLVLLSGCSETAALQAGEITETEEAGSDHDFAGKTVTGQVTSVSGDMAEICTGKMVYDSGMMNGFLETAVPDTRMHSGKNDGEQMEDFPGNIQEGIFVPTGDTFIIQTETELFPGDYIEIVFAPDGSVDRISPAWTPGEDSASNAENDGF